MSLVRRDDHGLLLSGPCGERLRIDVLEPYLVRVCHAPDGNARMDRTWTVVGMDADCPPQGRARDDYTPFGRPRCEVAIANEQVRMATDALTVHANLAGGCLEWSTAEGKAFAGDVPGRAYTYDGAGRAVYHFLTRRDDEHYYGFGECAGPLDKRGRRLRLFAMDAPGYDARATDPLYKHVPFYITLVRDGEVAYGLLYDNPAAAVFDLGREISGYHPPYRYYRAEDGDLDYYLIYGPTVAQVVQRLGALTGRMALPPKWSLGYLGSTMAYTETADAENQLQHFIEQCRAHELPCDMFHLSSGYTAGEDGKRYVFTWNRARIPEPAAMAARFHRAGIKLAANVKPCLLTTHPRYGEVEAWNGFIRDEDRPLVEPFWGGGGSHVDFTHAESFRWWKRQLTDHLLAVGIDAIWNDNNEYPIENDDAQCEGFGAAVPVALCRPVQTLLMNRAAYEAQLEARPDQRPFVISRSGCPGLQRYAQTWSGDNVTSWATLAYNLPMGLGLSLCGVPNVGHDVGGFCGPPPDPELFVRWVQNGIFHPRFTIHSAGDAAGPTEPWMYPDVLPLIRSAVSFRYRLVPYLYALLHECARSGTPVIRPMVYAFQRDAPCRTESFDFMLGPYLLVASVLEPGARTRAVYLPAGKAWCDFYTGRWYEGGRTVDVPAPLERIPLLVPEGGMIPMGKAMPYIGHEADDVREVHVFPARRSGVGRFLLYEDDGASLAYREGSLTRVRLEVEATPDALRLAATTVANGFPLPYRDVEFVLPHGEARRIEGAHALGHDPDGHQRARVLVASQS